MLDEWSMPPAARMNAKFPEDKVFPTLDPRNGMISNEPGNPEPAIYVPNLPGIIFHGVCMFFILASVLYVAEVPLGRFGRYEEPVYTFICGITLGLFPLAVIMTFTPFTTPWKEAAAFLYTTHALVTGVLFAFIDNLSHQILAASMLLVDVVMVIGLLARYTSRAAILLPYKLDRVNPSTV